jgi:glycosyltransferase involved in cell wall biosynthesis
MKIAFISRWYWEENRRAEDEENGGPTRQLAEAVAALGHEVVVLSQSPTKKVQKTRIGTLDVWLSPRDRRRDLMTGLRDKFAKKKFNHRKVYSDAYALRDFIKKCGPFDAIWAHTESPDGLIVGVAAQMGLTLPPVLLQIQALRYRFEKGAPVFTEKMQLGLAFKYATRILANSEMVATMLHNYGISPEDFDLKVRVVYPNLSRALLNAAQHGTGVAEPMKDRILFLGALNQGKGALVFLNALPRTEMSKRSSTFVVIGDFTEDNPRFLKRWEEVKEETRVKTLGARIEYLGRVTPYEVVRQIRLARAVVIPSLFDAFARTLAEAIILGRPVITTDRVGAWPLVQTNQCGIVIPANDPRSLAHAIDAVLSPIVPFAENAQRVAQRFIHEFSPEAIALQIVYHLKRITGDDSEHHDDEDSDHSPAYSEPQIQPVEAPSPVEETPAEEPAEEEPKPDSEKEW